MTSTHTHTHTHTIILRLNAQTQCDRIRPVSILFISSLVLSISWWYCYCYGSKFYQWCVVSHAVHLQPELLCSHFLPSFLMYVQLFTSANVWFCLYISCFCFCGSIFFSEWQLEAGDHGRFQAICSLSSHSKLYTIAITITMNCPNPYYFTP